MPALGWAANPSFTDTYGSNGVLTAVTGSGGGQKIAIGFRDGGGGFLANASGVLVNGGSGALHWATVSNTNLFNSDQFAESAGIVSIKTTAFVTNLTVFTELFITNSSDHFATLFLESSNHVSTLGIDTVSGQAELISEGGIVIDPGAASLLLKDDGSSTAQFQGGTWTLSAPTFHHQTDDGTTNFSFFESSSYIYGGVLNHWTHMNDGSISMINLGTDTNGQAYIEISPSNGNGSSTLRTLIDPTAVTGPFIPYIWDVSPIATLANQHTFWEVGGSEIASLWPDGSFSISGQPNRLSVAFDQLLLDGIPIGPPMRVPYYTNNIWVATNGNDSTATFNDPLLPALTPTNAIAIANAAGGFCNIVLLAGVYDVGTNVLFVPTNSNIIGVGGPLIKSSARLLFQQNPTFVPADNSAVAGITVTNTFKETDFTAAWGTDSSRGFTNAFLIRCRITGGTDGVYINCPLEFKQYTVYQCIIDTDWDQLVMFDSNTTWLIKDCTFIGHGPWAGDTGQPVHGPIIRGTGEISGCTIIESGPNSDNVGILNSLFAGSEGTFEICGTTFVVSGTAATNIVMNTASTLTICDNAPEGNGFGFPSGLNVLWPTTNSVGVLTNNATGDLGFATSLSLAGTIATGAPAGSTNPTWKLGGNTNSVSVISKATNTLVIAVNGTNLYLPFSLSP